MILSYKTMTNNLPIYDMSTYVHEYVPLYEPTYMEKNTERNIQDC